MLKTWFFYPIFLVVTLLSASAHGEDFVEAYTAGPEWETFTNSDGTGLYHEVIREIFSLYGISVKHEYVPTNRGDELVLLGQADMMTCDDRATSEQLRLSRYPLYVNKYYAFFNKAAVGPWSGVETLRDRTVACQLGYYHEWDFSVPVDLRDLPSGVKCLQMVLLGRSDFYVDDMLFIEDSIKRSGLSFNRLEYDTQEVGTRSYHPVFNKTERGRAVMKLFDEGIIVLHKAGKLKPFYDKWGHDYPDFDSF